MSNIENKEENTQNTPIDNQMDNVKESVVSEEAEQQKDAPMNENAPQEEMSKEALKAKEDEVLAEEESVPVEKIPAIPEKSYFDHSREELVEDLRELLVEPSIESIKTSVEAIKQAFYKKQREMSSISENEDISDDFDEEDNENIIDDIKEKGSEVVESIKEEAGELVEEVKDEVKDLKDGIEEQFKELLSKYKGLKAAANALKEKQKEKNLEMKKEILAKLEALTNSNPEEDLSTTIPAFRKLQQEWRKIDQVPQRAVNEIWKTYNKYQEQFYDLIKINNELREYDFKKNLELKTSLCETAEKLENEPNAVLAFNTLQRLHDEWRDVGPVAKEEREPIWHRFKEASTKINKKHQAYFEELKAKSEENLRLKTELCEKIENIDTDLLKTRKDWDDKTKEVLGIQEDWKTIGFAPKKHNGKIFRRFREACDKFFKAKNGFYKALKEEMNQNLAKRRELVAKAEELKNSEDWRQAAEAVKQLQKEWKTIGFTARKHSNELWEKFSSACDYVFDQRANISSEERAKEEENLKLKKEVIEKIKAFEPTKDREKDVDSLKELVSEFNKIGFVPRKEKSAIQKEFKQVVDGKYDIVFDRVAKKENRQFTEKQNKYMKEYNNLKKEIAAYENNILFLNSSSKAGNNLVDEINKKVKKLKDKLKDLSDNI